MKILLVDDEDQFRNSLMLQLKNRKYTVYEASTGEEAIELIKNENIDITLLDMRMPGMNGAMTLKKIKEISPLTEVIMLTGHATVKTAMEIITMGGFDYIVKPVKLNELIYKLEDAYKKKKLEEKAVEVSNNGHEADKK